jgi:hypothetical protein
MFVMRLYKLFVAAGVGLGVLAMVLSAAAFALPEFLPSEGNTSFTGNLDSGNAILENSAGSRIECTSAPSKDGGETDTAGTFKTEFKGCETAGFECKTTGSVKGQIDSEGSFSFVYDTLGTGETLGVAIVFLGKLTEFECAGALIKNVIRGSVLCLVLTPLTSSITHLLHCLKGTNKGEAAEKKFWNDNGTIVEAQLLANQNSAGFKEASLQALAASTTLHAGAWMNE